MGGIMPALTIGPERAIWQERPADRQNERVDDCPVRRWTHSKQKYGTFGGSFAGVDCKQHWLRTTVHRNTWAESRTCLPNGARRAKPARTLLWLQTRDPMSYSFK
jgi:hypothetical protein